MTDELKNTQQKTRSIFASRIRLTIGGSLFVIAIVAVVAIAFVPRLVHMGVGASPASSLSAAVNSGSAPQMEQDVVKTSLSAAGQFTSISTDSATSTPSSQRLVIETATLNITSKNVQTASQKLTQLVAEENGFVQSMNEYTDQGKSAISMTLRIPETDYRTFLDDAKSTGTVNNLSQTGQDVTQEHDNLQGQIKELQTEADAYTRLYSKAQSMNDMLEIQQSLTQVNGQIADLNSQIHNLNRAVQLATININIETDSVSNLSKNPAFISSLFHSIRFMGQAGLSTLTIIAWLLPWGVLVGIIGLGWRLWIRWYQSRPRGQ